MIKTKKTIPAETIKLYNKTFKYIMPCPKMDVIDFGDKIKRVEAETKMFIVVKKGHFYGCKWELRQYKRSIPAEFFEEVNIFETDNNRNYNLN